VRLDGGDHGERPPVEVADEEQGELAITAAETLHPLRPAWQAVELDDDAAARNVELERER